MIERTIALVHHPLQASLDLTGRIMEHQLVSGIEQGRLESEP